MAIGAAIDRGLAFLARRQLPSGQFATCTAPEFGTGEDPVFDSTTFGTALVVHALGFADRVVARNLIDRALAFLLETMEPPGVWRFWTPGHPRHLEIPADSDDTACASQVLWAHGVAFPDNRPLLLANRDPRGLFYTWLVPRWGPPPLHLGYWRVASRRWRSPMRTRPFFRITQALPHDVDSVVNANILLYLGHVPATQPVVDHLTDTLRRQHEEGHDKWYHSRFAFYYFVSRCVQAGVEALDPLGDEVLERIAAATQGDGSVGKNALETALAICATQNWRRSSREIDRAYGYLLTSQASDGGWPAAGLYGVHGTLEWGSQELTTAFCLEALVRHEALITGAGV